MDGVLYIRVASGCWFWYHLGDNICVLKGPTFAQTMSDGAIVEGRSIFQQKISK